MNNDDLARGFVLLALALLPARTLDAFDTPTSAAMPPIEIVIGTYLGGGPFPWTQGEGKPIQIRPVTEYVGGEWRPVSEILLWFAVPPGHDVVNVRGTFHLGGCGEIGLSALDWQAYPAMGDVLLTRHNAGCTGEPAPVQLSIPVATPVPTPALISPEGLVRLRVRLVGMASPPLPDPQTGTKAPEHGYEELTLEIEGP